MTNETAFLYEKQKNKENRRRKKNKASLAFKDFLPTRKIFFLNFLFHFGNTFLFGVEFLFIMPGPSAKKAKTVSAFAEALSMLDDPTFDDEEVSSTPTPDDIVFPKPLLPVLSPDLDDELFPNEQDKLPEIHKKVNFNVLFAMIFFIYFRDMYILIYPRKQVKPLNLNILRR